MKIRTGFVSNSSSASFIVSIDKGSKEFYDMVFGSGVYGYVEERVMYKIESMEEDFVKYYGPDATQFKDSNSEWVQECKKDAQAEIDEARILKSKLNEYRSESKAYPIEFFIGMLDFLGINYIGHEYKTELSSWTSMFNDYGDIPEELARLIVSILFSLGKDIKMDYIVKDTQ